MARTLIGRTVRRLRSEQRPVAAGAGDAARHLGQLSEPDRARSARGDRLAADQARRDAAGRSGDAVRHAANASSRSGCARPSPTRCWAPMRCPRRRSPRWRPAARTRRARCWRCIAPGAWRARMPAASRCPPGGACCCRTRRCATSSTTAPTIFRRWKTAAEAIAGELRRGARPR